MNKPLKHVKPGHCSICGKCYETVPHGTTVKLAQDGRVLGGVCGPRLTGAAAKKAVRL